MQHSKFIPSRRIKSTAWSAAIFGIAFQSVALAAPPAYRVVALPTVIPEVKNVTSVSVGDINNAGDVVGKLSDNTSNASAAVFWDGQTHAVSALKTDVSSIALAASRINDSKVITGSNYASKRGGKVYAITWDTPWNDATRLQLLEGKARGEAAVGINNAGVIVGSTFYGRNLAKTKATMWTPGGSVSSLGYLPGAENGTVPSAINDSGVVVGSATQDNDSSLVHPFMWTAASGMVDLGVAPGTEFTIARDINNANQIVLSAGSYAQLTARRVVTWSAPAGYMDLGVLPNPKDNQSLYPFRINQSGNVIGSYLYVPDNTIQVFYASAQTGMVDVRTLIDPNDPLKAILTSASTSLSIGGLNDQGMISLGYQTSQPQGGFVSGAVVLVPKD